MEQNELTDAIHQIGILLSVKANMSNTEVNTYRCPNGHEIKISGDISKYISLSITQGEKICNLMVCLICLAEWLDKHIPDLELVEE